MNKNNLIGQKNIGLSKQPSSYGVMYGCSVGVSSHEAQGVPSPVVASEDAEPCVMDGNDESEGKEKALAVGCNANNGNASARTANCNNGSYEIKEFFKLVDDGAVSLPLKTKVCSEGTSFYFEQFHTSNQEACELICKELGI